MVYPKWLYHKTEEAKVVNTKEEHEALGSEWKESPADFDKPAQKVELKAEVKSEEKAKAKGEKA